MRIKFSLLISQEMPKKHDPANNVIDWRDDWRNCRAKKKLIEDLEKGQIPLFPEAMSAEVAHQQRPLYQEVPFTKFKRNFEALRTAIREEKARASRDSEGLAQYRQHHPVQPFDQAGRRRWDKSDAQALLRHEMQQKLHEQTTPKQMWESREEYKQFDQDRFRDQIYAEERRQKRLAAAAKRKHQEGGDGSESDG
jgi:hypothetical protein